MSNIALDYDGTITEDPIGWLHFCLYMAKRGHKIWIVTMRYPSEGQDMDQRFTRVIEGTIFTSRQAKGPACKVAGLDIHIWIDDNPKAVDMSATEIWGDVTEEGHTIVPVHEPKG